MACGKTVGLSVVDVSEEGFDCPGESQRVEALSTLRGATLALTGVY
jgi:hypothetical protein